MLASGPILKLFLERLSNWLDVFYKDGIKICVDEDEILALQSVRQKKYDKILLDAPCSGERGVVKKKSELEEWKEKRTKNFGIRQYALLASAFLCLKPGHRNVKLSVPSLLDALFRHRAS